MKTATAICITLLVAQLALAVPLRQGRSEAKATQITSEISAEQDKLNTVTLPNSARTDSTKSDTKSDTSKTDTSGKDSGECGCIKTTGTPSTNTCLDFTGPIPNDEVNVKCEMRPCTVTPSQYKCVNSGATDKCVVKKVNRKGLQFLKYADSGDYGICILKHYDALVIMKKSDGTSKDATTKDAS
eukprot:CAMPEP_0174893338 /NCGR_PEP_ID=MMETSP0167-20121228/8158_1 /TAXON_ID=38298 /ORGANISM="Rhodella maculata, Strain CCMP736" /LENGTH=184 /DNA_ID=CAMNT_0016132103 /DNA_START=59 /DNA_END=613 /DNA_ORIENTATION=+